MAGKKKSETVKRVLLLVIGLPVFLLCLNFGAKASFSAEYQSELAKIAQSKGLEFANGITPQITLAMQMAKTVSVIEYMKDPSDREKASRALSEFSSYQNTFLGKTVFYMNDVDHDFYSDCRLSYHVDITDPANNWWQKTMYETPTFNFNINYNPELKAINLWLNVPVRSYNTAIGMCGTGIPLDTFTSKMYDDLDGTGIQMLFYNSDYEITTALNTDYVENKVSVRDLLPQIPESVLKPEYAESAHFSDKKGEYAVYVLSDLGWYLVVYKNYGVAEFFKHLTTPLVILIILGFIIAALVIVIKAYIPLRQMSATIVRMASGDADLSRRLDEPRSGTIKTISEMVGGFNLFVSNLQEIVDSIKRSDQELNIAGTDMGEGIQRTSEATSKIVTSVAEFSQAIDHQTQSVSEAGGAVNQISANIESLSHMIATQSQSVSTASSAVEEMVGNIDSVNRSVEFLHNSFDKLETESTEGIAIQEKVNTRMAEIDKQSKMLQEANKVISSIASQTNLLAMNAAIEAAHAGEAGRGFSVVADEIRKLSETSASQSKTIGVQLKEIQQSIGNMVNENARSRETYVNVNRRITETSALVQQIAAAMEEQESGSKQIVDSLATLNDATAEVRTSSGEMAAGSKTILDQMRNLQEATVVMRDGMSEIASDTDEIQKTQDLLEGYSSQMTNSIDAIGEKLQQFK